MKKTFHDLSKSDVKKFPLWRFTNNDQVDELEIESIRANQVDDLSGVIVATQVVFHDESKHWALLQNVSLLGKQRNDHFLSVTIYADKRWFPLARYHDVAIDDWGPAKLAAFMNKDIAGIFPIKFDLREVLQSNSNALVGMVLAEPANPLTQDEIIELVLLS
jgi:hypothetical protein